MKNLLLLILFIFISSFYSKAQTWSQVPGYQISYNDVLGVTRHQSDLWVLAKSGIYKVTGSTWQLTSSAFTVNSSLGCIYSDGTDLYAGGVFYFGATPIVIVKWDGGQWVPFAYSNNTGVGPVLTILKTSTGNIYAGGLFNTIGTQSVLSNFVYFAMFDGATWNQPFVLSATGCSFGVEGIEKIGDSIYVAGGFHEVNGISSISTFRFKEGAGMSNLDDYGFCFTARDYQVYQGSLYAGGTRRSDNISVDIGLSKRSGNSWISNIDQIQITRTKIAVLLGKMYIAGRATGSPINGFVPIVVSYDGTNVVNEGSGVSSPPSPFSYVPEATGIFADTIAGKLYLYGNFLQSNSNVADNFAVMNFSTLPVHLSSFSAERSNDKNVVLRWVDETPEEGVKFDVQMSIDGRVFHSIGQVAEQVNKNNYSFTYTSAECGKLFFRLAFEGKYSDIRSVSIACDVSIVSDNHSLRIQTKYPGTLTLTNSSGQRVLSTAVASGYSQMVVSVPTGIYVAEFFDKNGVVFTKKIVIQ